MLDIKFIRESSALVKKSLKKRKDTEKIKWVDELFNLDKEWRSLKQEVDKLRHKRNIITDEIMKLRKAGRNASEVVELAERKTGRKEFPVIFVEKVVRVY